MIKFVLVYSFDLNIKVIFIIIVDNNSNFTCFLGDLVVLEDLEECQENKNLKVNKKNKLIQQHITNFWV